MNSHLKIRFFFANLDAWAVNADPQQELGEMERFAASVAGCFPDRIQGESVSARDAVHRGRDAST